MIMGLKVSNTDTDWMPKYFAPLVGIFCGLYVITNALNAKLIEVWGIALPVGIITFPICTIITDIMTEVYGFNRARQAIWAVLMCTILYAAFTTLGIYLPGASFWQNQDAYAAIFNTSWRMAVAGCAAWLTGELMNSFIVSKMKVKQNGDNMAARFIGSTVIGQFIDTLVFFSIAFTFIMPWDAFFKMLFWVWAAKVAYEVIALPLSLAAARKMKQLEGVEHFDRQRISVI